MFQWERKPLSELADLCLGKMLDQRKNKGELRPYLANVNVRWGEISLDNLRTMRFEAKENERYGIKFGDIVMCEGGEPGRCAIWKDQVPGMMIQKALHRIRPQDLLDYRFLFYSFLHLGKTKVFDQYFTGATIKHLPGEKLAKVEIDFPPLEEQKRIAGILSTYDDLIENCQRRIQVLEKMARALYREWFVHFKFPGHENVKIVDGIPEGWVLGQLGEICHVIPGYAFKSKDWQSSGVSVVKIKNIRSDNTIDTELTAFVSEEVFSRTQPKFILSHGDILLAMTGATAGKVGKLRTYDKMLLNQRVAKLKPHPSFSEFIWYSVSSQEAQRGFFLLADGAAQPNMSGAQIEGVKLLCPTKELVEQFSNLVGPVLRQTDTLYLKIQNLRKTRDLLLPRLLSGDIQL